MGEVWEYEYIDEDEPAHWYVEHCPFWAKNLDIGTVVEYCDSDRLPEPMEKFESMSWPDLWRDYCEAQKLVGEPDAGDPDEVPERTPELLHEAVAYVWRGFVEEAQESAYLSNEEERKDAMYRDDDDDWDKLPSYDRRFC